MAEEEDVSATGAGSGDALAAQMAMGTANSAASEAYLRKHGTFLDLQIENLKKLDEYELSHLRWRRFNDQMKGAMQIMVVAVGLLVVIGIGTTVWNASLADGLIVDAFTVPPDFEKSGTTGDVVAGDITSRVTTIRKIAMDISYSVSRDVSADRHNDIKLEIPETGVSISEVWRMLRTWLGHERHLTGNVRDLGNGRIALTTSLDGGTALTEAGAASDLSAIEQRAAEDVFAAFDPVNHINYLSFEGHPDEALAAAERFVLVSTDQLHADSYSLLSLNTAIATGDVPLALARAQVGIDLDPKLAVLHVMTARYHYYLGHEEARLAQDRLGALPVQAKAPHPQVSMAAARRRRGTGTTARFDVGASRGELRPRLASLGLGCTANLKAQARDLRKLPHAGGNTRCAAAKTAGR